MIFVDVVVFLYIIKVNVVWIWRILLLVKEIMVIKLWIVIIK